MEGESGRVHCVRGVALEVMHTLGADERGHLRRTGTIWRTGVARDIHDGELGSEPNLAITDWQSNFADD